MSKKYKYPPIIEAVCEFRLSRETKWDVTIPGLVYSRVSKTFPLKESRILREIQLEQKQTGEMKQDFVQSDQAVFLTKEKNIFMQLSPFTLSVNCLKPYPHWEVYFRYIKRAYNALKAVIPEYKFERIGLRYINEIVIPHDPVKIEDYFNYYPETGKIKNLIGNFHMNSTFLQEKSGDLCRVQLLSNYGKNKRDINIILDLDYFCIPEIVSKTGAIKWVDEAHTGLNDIFEKSITDNARKLFQRKKKDGIKAKSKPAARKTKPKR